MREFGLLGAGSVVDVVDVSICNEYPVSGFHECLCVVPSGVGTRLFGGTVIFVRSLQLLLGLIQRLFEAEEFIMLT